MSEQHEKAAEAAVIDKMSEKASEARNALREAQDEIARGGRLLCGSIETADAALASLQFGLAILRERLDAR